MRDRERQGGRAEGGLIDQSRTDNKIVVKEQTKQKSLAQSFTCIHKSPRFGTPVGDLHRHMYHLHGFCPTVNVLLILTNGQANHHHWMNFNSNENSIF